MLPSYPLSAADRNSELLRDPHTFSQRNSLASQHPVRAPLLVNNLQDIVMQPHSNYMVLPQHGLIIAFGFPPSINSTTRWFPTIQEKMVPQMKLEVKCGFQYGSYIFSASRLCHLNYPNEENHHQTQLCYIQNILLQLCVDEKAVHAPSLLPILSLSSLTC